MVVALTILTTVRTSSSLTFCVAGVVVVSGLYGFLTTFVKTLLRFLPLKSLTIDVIGATAPLGPLFSWFLYKEAKWARLLFLASLILLSTKAVGLLTSSSLSSCCSSMTGLIGATGVGSSTKTD